MYFFQFYFLDLLDLFDFFALDDFLDLDVFLDLDCFLDFDVFLDLVLFFPPPAKLFLTGIACIAVSPSSPLVDNISSSGNNLPLTINFISTTSGFPVSCRSAKTFFF